MAKPDENPRSQFATEHLDDRRRVELVPAAGDEMIEVDALDQSLEHPLALAAGHDQLDRKTPVVAVERHVPNVSRDEQGVDVELGVEQDDRLDRAIGEAG
ncbi:hypothetical protein [Sphingomonas sp. NFR04]|uniref:hypothetical protein n=1 Tax=Sphingomonas sp. NFR04 TaxID=1566283 RepID=UPI001587298E|nr:hypothetical protein [Sphingomonas sp. NFR04]